MGSDQFFMKVSGKSPEEAFQNAIEHGHSGYTGTIAEKHEFTMIEVPKGVKPEAHASTLIDNGDERIDDKWGPAGCIAMGKNQYLFFGWASC